MSRAEITLRVLVVDDDEDVLVMMGDALRARGYEVATARDGREAVDLAESFEPDVALVDVVLPDVSGITLASILRGATPHDGSPRIVAYSGSDALKLREAVDRGLFDDCVVKPATLDRIERAIRAT
ncbi:MAG TPA: response regulator [Kofleriaceae bacterium]|jgi:two-component system OmpR family response regulator